MLGVVKLSHHSNYSGGTMGRMPNRSREPRAPVAAEAWRRIFDFIATTADQRDRVLERLDLTPGDVRALNSLATGEGKTMASLAREWRCDACATIEATSASDIRKIE